MEVVSTKLLEMIRMMKKNQTSSKHHAEEGLGHTKKGKGTMSSGFTVRRRGKILSSAQATLLTA